MSANNESQQASAQQRDSVPAGEATGASALTPLQSEITKISQKDIWDKVDILLKPSLAVFAAVLVAYLSYIGSNLLTRQQNLEAKQQLYAELMSSREASDSSLRKEMFNTSLRAFLEPSTSKPVEKIIKLELLAHNFHNSLDIAPLFEHLHRQLSEDRTTENQELSRRLLLLAQQVNDKQLAALESVGSKRDASIWLDELPPNGATIIDIVRLRLPQEDLTRNFSLEVLSIDVPSKRLRLRLVTWAQSAAQDLDYNFEVGVFDFPMVRNIRLPGGNRCAVVVRNLTSYGAEVTLVYFPGSRAALKEKPYFDELIEELLIDN